MRNAKNRLTDVLDPWDAPMRSMLHIGGILFCYDVEIKKDLFGFTVRLHYSEWTQEDRDNFLDASREETDKIEIRTDNIEAARCVVLGMIARAGLPAPAPEIVDEISAE